MRTVVFCLSLLVASAAPVAAGDAPAKLDAEKLLGRLRVTYSHSTSFSPSAIRYPLRKDALGDYETARAAADETPGSADLRLKAALAADAAEHPQAAREWQLALALIEAQLKPVRTAGKPERGKPGKEGGESVDPALLERHVEALVGADVAIRAVTAAEKLLAARPDSWRTQLLVGDAYLRRADFNWRVLVRRSAGTKDLNGAQLIQMNSDLGECEKAYNQAVKLAPAEAGPRGARIALRLALPLMASFLPKGAVKAPEILDQAAVKADLLEWVKANPGKVAPLWHTLHFFAGQSSGEVRLTPAEQSALEQALGAAQAAGDEALFLHEAKGMLALIKGQWGAAREEFEAALGVTPERDFAAEWLGVAEADSTDPRPEVIARVRKRLAERPRSQDWALLGVLLASEQRTEAIDALRQSLKVNVDNANARYNLALLLLQRDPQSDEALHHLSLALTLRGDDREARFAYAVVIGLHGQVPEARRSLEALLKLYEIEPRLKSSIEATLKDLPAPALPNPIAAEAKKPS